MRYDVERRFYCFNSFIILLTLFSFYLAGCGAQATETRIAHIPSPSPTTEPLYPEFRAPVPNDQISLENAHRESVDELLNYLGITPSTSHDAIVARTKQSGTDPEWGIKKEFGPFINKGGKQYFLITLDSGEMKPEPDLGLIEYPPVDLDYMYEEQVGDTTVYLYGSLDAVNKFKEDIDVKRGIFETFFEHYFSDAPSKEKYFHIDFLPKSMQRDYVNLDEDTDSAYSLKDVRAGTIVAYKGGEVTAIHVIIKLNIIHEDSEVRGVDLYARIINSLVNEWANTVALNHQIRENKLGTESAEGFSTLLGWAVQNQPDLAGRIFGTSSYMKVAELLAEGSMMLAGSGR